MEKELDKYLSYVILFDLWKTFVSMNNIDSNIEFINGFVYNEEKVRTYCYNTPNNLSRAISGDRNDIAILLGIIRYINCNDIFKNSIIKAITKLCGENEYINLLNFWYGSDILTLSTAQPIIEVVKVNDKLKNETPIISHTCFFKLDIPEYEYENEYKLIELIKCRLEESIKGYLLLKDSGDSFNIV
jgi:hypothetical protein